MSKEITETIDPSDFTPRYKVDKRRIQQGLPAVDVIVDTFVHDKNIDLIMVAMPLGNKEEHTELLLNSLNGWYYQERMEKERERFHDRTN